MKTIKPTTFRTLKILLLFFMVNYFSAQRLPLDNQNKYFLQTTAGLCFEDQEWNLRKDFTAGVKMEYFISRQISLEGGLHYLTLRYTEDIPKYHPSPPVMPALIFPLDIPMMPLW